MIGYLKGKVISFDDTNVIIETGGVGYDVACSASVYQKLVSDGFGEAFIYTAVKEDGIFLYGFNSVEEKKIFLQLISVSGVGPKMGITVLSSMSIAELTLAIATSNVKALSSVKGLGKKTAERIILELKEKVAGDFDASTGEISVSPAKKANQDAVMALVSLGFNKAESEKAVVSAENSGAKSIEEIIAYALKNIK